MDIESQIEEALDGALERLAAGTVPPIPDELRIARTMQDTSVCPDR